MKFIHSYLIIPLSEDEISELSLWLESAHAPFALDKRTDRVIVFNISGRFLMRLLNLFSLTDWTYSTKEAPDEYVELFNHVNYCLEQNLVAYKRCFSKDPSADTTLTHSEDIELMKRAFTADNYREWHRRFYLTRHIRAIDALTFVHIYNEDEDELSTASGLIAGHAHEYWQYPDYYPDAHITASIRIDPDGNKAMIGWFFDSDHFLEYNVDHEAIRQVNDRMKSWFSEMNITSNAHNPEQVNKILNTLGIVLHGSSQYNHRTGFLLHGVSAKYKNINNFVIIDSDTLQISPAGRIGKEYAYAYDYKYCRIIIFNIDEACLLFLLEQDHLSGLSYSPRNMIKDYEKLLQHVDKQMEINKSRPQTIGHYISSANSYIRQQMNIAHLRGIDVHNLPDIE